MVPEIDISNELLPRHHAALATMAQLGTKYGPGRWAIVGGMMVMILGREHLARSPRAEGTKDADIVVDLVTNPGLLGDVVHFLTSMGYELQDAPGEAGKAARCSFVFHSAHIDVLCPNDTPESQLVVPQQGVASIAIPGGRRALETARPVSLYFSDDHANAEVFVPTLAGAIMVKAAAATDVRTASSQRHLQDVAFLLTVPADPEETQGALTPDDVELLRRIEGSIADGRSPMWVALDGGQRQRAMATFAFLTA